MKLAFFFAMTLTLISMMLLPCGPGEFAVMWLVLLSGLAVVILNDN